MPDASGSVLEQFDYLPFGERCINSSLAFVNTGKTDYLYGGKELPQLFGIDWYDSVARWQTTSGVFTSPDPLMEKYYSVSPYVYCKGNPVKRIDPYGMDDKDKIAGAIKGIFTNIIPCTGSLRDVYKPSDASDYNQALQKVDEVSLIAGAAMVSGGGTMAAAGETVSAAGAAATLTIVGAPEGAAAITGGAALATAGEAIASSGVVMMANAADNAKDGYNRGKQNTSTENSNNAAVNGETASTKKGKEEHKKYNPGPGYKLNSRLPSGKRPDAYSVPLGKVRELKPNNQKAIKRGEKQVEAYKQELEKLFPNKNWKSYIDTY